MRAVLIALGLLAGVSLVTPSSALAECDGPYPSFQNAAPTARRIVIGEVIAGFPGPVGPQDGRTSRFTLRGRSVLEGDAPIEIDVTDLQSQQCAGYILARPGDRIAIAFDGHEFGQVVNAVAWLEGRPPDLIGVESTTIDAVYALVGRAPPVARPTTPASPQGATTGWPNAIGLCVLAALVAAIGFVLWRRAHSSLPR
jgi:hypothetical protein